MTIKSKKVLFFLILFITLALVARFVAIPARAEEPQEKPQLAPVSAAFEAYRQKPPGEFYGYIPPPIDLSHLKDIPVERPAPRRQLAQPDSFDWRTEGKVTPVKDQGDAGTCWVFGTLAAVESKVLIGESVEYDFSEQNLVCCTDPSWVYLHDNRRYAGGWSWLATDTLTKKGSRLESCDPYDVETINTEACNDSCTTIERITGYRLVAPTTDLVKAAVSSEGPVSMAFYWNITFFNDVTYIYEYPDCPEPPNHLVSIVGWDDTINSGAWIVKNSWGTDFGDSGFFYLCYDSGSMGEVAFYQYKDYDSLEKVYYWDEAGWVNSLGYTASNYAWMASVFTAEQSGTLTNVDFWTTSNNAQYEIYVYDDGDPSDGLGNELTSQSGTCQEAGYYSVALASPSLLSASQPFTIAVKMTTPGYNYPIPVEYEWVAGLPPTTLCDPPIQTGVSYIRHLDAGNWADLAPNYNACLRAKIYENPLVSVSVSPTSVVYGALELETSKNTVQLGQTLTITNDGNVTLDLKIKSGNAIRGGGTDWILVTGTPGENEFKHESSVESGGWTVIGSDYGSAIATVTAGGSKSLDLQIEMPTTITDYGEHTITVTILAVE